MALISRGGVSCRRAAAAQVQWTSHDIGGERLMTVYCYQQGEGCSGLFKAGFS